MIAQRSVDDLGESPSGKVTLPFHLYLYRELLIGELRPFTLRLGEFVFLRVEAIDQAPPLETEGVLVIQSVHGDLFGGDILRLNYGYTSIMHYASEQRTVPVWEAQSKHATTHHDLFAKHGF